MPSSNTPNSKENRKKKIKTKYPRGIQGKIVTFDELIMIPKWDTKNLTYDHIVTLQDLLARKTK